MTSRAPFEREELEEMVRRWAEAGRRAEASWDWAGELGSFYTEDARCVVHLGAHEVYEGRGRAAIEAQVLGEDMRGFEGWTYPHERRILDEVQGTVVVYWRQVSPYRRPDGSSYAVSGLGCSLFDYAGDFRWSFQQDVFDLEQVKTLLFELAADGLLAPPLKQRLRAMAWGARSGGYRPDAHAMKPVKRVRSLLAMGRIALLGR